MHILDINVPGDTSAWKGLFKMCTSPNYMLYVPPTGKTLYGSCSFKFQPHANYEKILKSGVPFIEVPCQKCLECRIQSARTWADRCVLEAKKYKDNYFVTLTYDDTHLPSKGSLVPDDLKNFLKRLRKRIGSGVRFFACGEYGSKGLRPHYHLLLFNCPLNDLSFEFFKLDDEGQEKLHYRPDGDLMFSRSIFEAWQKQGMISVGKVSYDSAAYISQYCTKKINHDYTDKLEALGLHPEFLRMSNRPGIGASSFDAQQLDNDLIIVFNPDGAHKSSVPRYYDKLFIQKYGEDFFNQFVRSKRNLKRAQKMINYDHSNSFKDTDNYYKSLRIEKTHQFNHKNTL